MNPQRDAWSDALRELAATSPEASPELHARLGHAFAHHHARRRMRQRISVVLALAVCIGISVYWLRPHGQVAKVKFVEPAAQAAKAPAPVPQVVIPQDPERPQPPAVAKAAIKPRVHPKQADNLDSTAAKVSNHVEPQPVAADTGDFVALSTFDPAIPIGESRMVRIDLPGSALQLIGYPVEGQLLDRRILTDVLVGQDGMPYAVRLVRTRNVH